MPHFGVNNILSECSKKCKKLQLLAVAEVYSVQCGEKKKNEVRPTTGKKFIQTLSIIHYNSWWSSLQIAGGHPCKSLLKALHQGFSTHGPPMYFV
jgi:hypothetical protein